MTPAIALLILEALVKYGPSTARQLVQLFQNENPTMDDWNKVFETVNKSYDDYTKPKPFVS